MGLAIPHGSGLGWIIKVFKDFPCDKYGKFGIIRWVE
jgi:hypothetical protein